MFLVNEYYYFLGALDKKTCNRIIKSRNKGLEKGSIEEGDSVEITDKEGRKSRKYEHLVNKKKRECDIAWINDQWIYDLIWPYMEEANAQAGWGYDIKAAESAQITRYKKGGFYVFHNDGRSDNLSAYNRPQNNFLHGNVRKLSMSILLNDDYEGGDFEFAMLDPVGKKVTKTPDFNKLGSIIVFPSFMMHRVKPVTKGVRYSLVSWFLGPPFK
jgi:PKHD-type hydroxylase